MERYLNIIAFNIPWPANYGGIIDVYYKIKALHQCGVKIILHCFEYERAHSPELEAIAKRYFIQATYRATYQYNPAAL